MNASWLRSETDARQTSLIPLAFLAVDSLDILAHALVSSLFWVFSRY